MMREVRMVCDQLVGVQPEVSPGEPEGVSPRSTPVAHTPGSPRSRRLRFAICLLIAIGSPVAVFAQGDDDFLPGLHAKYTANGRTVERIDADISFDWNSAAPDPRLSAGAFTAQWTGKLLNKKSDRYTFHAFVDGDCMLEIDGQLVLSGERNTAGWISGKPTDLRAGERILRLRFRGKNKTRRIHLFWSADRFSLEPIPTNLLFREKPFAELKRVETGQVLFDAHRCNRCHQRANDPPSSPGPDLTHVVTNLSATELTAKVHDPRHNAPHAKMPSFGFTKEESAAVAAFLRSVSKPVKLNPLPKARRQKPRKKSKYDVPKPLLSEKRSGEVLVRSVGCLACHTLNKHGSAGPYSGGNLTSVGQKRTAEWLYQWLLIPKTLNADHRMPVFKLANQERREIAVFLASAEINKASGGRKPAGDTMKTDRGRKLVEQSRCAACHTIPGVKFTPTKLPDFTVRVISDTNSCLKNPRADAPGSPRGKRRPIYKNINAAAVTAFLSSRTGKLSPLSPFETGRHVLARRNCTACHPRGLQRGIVETAGSMSKLDAELRGQSQGMIPPTLNAVGDKLIDTYLKTAIAGEQKTVRLPWLRVRMPRFSHAKDDSAALVSHLIAHDRIPKKAPLAISRKSKMPSDSQILVAGQTLLGIRGFSCIACHTVGEYEPRNVALGTRGSDLMQMAGRMRKPFFDRWTRSAIRIVPGMEMPSYHGKPVPGVLNDDVDLQLAVLWNALNDKRFKPPTNPSVVEQFLTIKPGAPARIVRDVFTVPKENGGGYIARSLAIGLNNGHNLLFDLDTYSLRGWYFGDFARQRTQGKSWYWDMAGVPVMTGFQPGFDFALLPEKGLKKKLIFPTKFDHAYCRLRMYSHEKTELQILYFMWFTVEGKQRQLSFVERISTLQYPENSAVSGWKREIKVFGQIQDHHVVVARPKPTSNIGSSKIEAIKSLNGRWESYAESKDREFVTLAFLNRAPVGFTGRSATLHYKSLLVREASRVKIKPKPQVLKPESITSVPGFDGVRLPVDRSIMPTSMTWTKTGQLVFSSLKGHVFSAADTNRDGLQDQLAMMAEGLAAPYGVLASGSGTVVGHKPEVLLIPDNSRKHVPAQSVLATGWGYNDNYHDWTCGIVRDKKGNLYIGLGSDYAQKDRPKEQSRWRGKVLRISPKGKVTPVGHAFRYPTGLAMNHTGDIFVTDNQGVQNTFNEINHLQQGKHYGVPSRHEENRDAPVTPPAIQVPHPWTRSVNGIFFLPKKRMSARRAGGVSPPVTSKDRIANNTGKTGGLTPTARLSYEEFAGHGIGCEYDNRFLIRFSLQKVAGEYQGACYAFSKPDSGRGKTNFLGPLCGGVAPDGAIYIGSIYDSGWLGGRNTGDIVRLVPNGKLPNGIRELRATKDGFEIEFIRPVDKTAALKPGSYTISGYTRVWKGSYATPDSGRHSLAVKAVSISADNKTVQLTVPNRRAGQYVYDVSVGKIGTKDQPELWPTTGYYTLHRIPKK